MANIGPHLLGRHVNHDPRSRNFAFTPTAAPPTRPVKWRHYGPILDQGSIGSCTANALDQLLNTAPAKRRGQQFTETDALELYHQETILQGGDIYPPADPGGSGLAVCQTARNMGLITEYAHVFGIEHARGVIPERPFLVGSNWYTSMFTPDGYGNVSVSGKIEGGHEYLCTGYDPKTETWRFVNSWGTSWPGGTGPAGMFFMNSETFSLLLDQQGDITVPLR